MKNSYFILVITSSIILGCFTNCKKYPENNLWFKNPKKISPISGHIIEYKVNGIDSLDLLNIYYEQVILHGYGPYNNSIRDVKQEIFFPRDKGKGKFEVICDLCKGCYFTWSNNKKSINIRSGVDIEYFKRNIFITQGLNWDVQYLDKKGKSKIKTTFNGNTYELTFDS